MKEVASFNMSLLQDHEELCFLLSSKSFVSASEDVCPGRSAVSLASTPRFKPFVAVHEEDARAQAKESERRLRAKEPRSLFEGGGSVGGGVEM